MATTVFDASATLAGTDDGNGNGNFNIRQLFTPTVLSAATGTQIRLTFLFGTAETSETPVIDDVYVGQCPGGGVNFTGDQVHVTFSGSGSVNGSAAGVVVSDWITLAQAWNNTAEYVVAWHGASGKNCNTSFAALTGTAQWGNSTPGATTASQTSPSGMTQFNNSTAALISKMEVQAAVTDVLMAQILL